jgi:hypothetical protein
MTYWTAEPTTAQGPRKGESSTCPMRNGFRTQPARSVRGSSRRIMTMRFRPANIRVINRRVCFWAVIGPAVQTKTRSRLTSGNVFPLRRPSTGARVPERCSPSKVRFAAPNSGAPLTSARRSGRMEIATGRSGGNTARGLRQKNKGRLASCGGEPARFKTRQVRWWGRNRVAPYQGTGSSRVPCPHSGATTGLKTTDLPNGTPGVFDGAPLQRASLPPQEPARRTLPLIDIIGGRR